MKTAIVRSTSIFVSVAAAIVLSACGSTSDSGAEMAEAELDSLAGSIWTG